LEPCILPRELFLLLSDPLELFAKLFLSPLELFVLSVDSLELFVLSVDSLELFAELFLFPLELLVLFLEPCILSRELLLLLLSDFFELFVLSFGFLELFVFPLDAPFVICLGRLVFYMTASQLEAPTGGGSWAQQTCLQLLNLRLGGGAFVANHLAQLEQQGICHAAGRGSAILHSRVVVLGSDGAGEEINRRNAGSPEGRKQKGKERKEAQAGASVCSCLPALTFTYPHL
jgi:hypothetical protein